MTANSPSLTAEQTALVTGGAGFVGSWLTRLLLEKTPARVAVLDNLRNGRREFLPADPRLDFHALDLTERLAVTNLVRQVRPAWVFHLGALHFIPYCNAHPDETLQVNVVGTQNVLDACLERPPEFLAIASTAAVYPIQEQPCREDDRVDPIDVYGLSKWTNEKQLQLFAAGAPTRCCAARLFNVFGPHETNPHVIPEILKQLAEGQDDVAVGNLTPKRDYIYATDVAAAFLAMAQGATQSFRTYNVGTGREYSVADILDGLGKVRGRPVRPLVAADRVRRVDRPHLVADASRLQRETGWQPQYDLARGLAALWQSTSGRGELA